ncbi:MAG: SDR family NAD(P)-dependent oxidoreductase [Firmicutes bacterium]|nr:SDR family NAD(P)-dependent oxidoreductase [Bacillota bacterium]
MRRPEPFWQDKPVFITGASSGIGEALALELAAVGARVGLFARRKERLEDIARRIQDAGGWAIPLPGDVSRRDDVHRAVARFNREAGPVEVLVANAGRGMGRTPDTDARAVDDLFGINFLGAVYSLEAVLPGMRDRGRGHIAAVSSALALLPGLFGSPTYAASKAAMGRYFEGVGRQLRPEGIFVTVVYPGFVRTEMTAGLRFLPFALEAKDAARRIRRTIERRKARCAFPRRALWLGRLAQLVPTRYQRMGQRRFR